MHHTQRNRAERDENKTERKLPDAPGEQCTQRLQCICMQPTTNKTGTQTVRHWYKDIERESVFGSSLKLEIEVYFTAIRRNCYDSKVVPIT